MKKILLLLVLLLVPVLSFAQVERFQLSPAICVSDEGTGITTATTLLAVDGVADKQIVVYKIYVQNIGATTSLVTLGEEDGDAFYSNNLLENQPAVFTLNNKIIKLAEAKGIEITSSATGDIRWTVCYGLEQ